jgi:sigma-B regulation protein RsbU (phosphoserine phosphatase)
VACGDLFFFFTDGISEAMDSGGESFGEERLAACLEAVADRSPEAIRDSVVGEVTAFTRGQPQHDDITMVILKFEDLEPHMARGEETQAGAVA